MERSGGAIQQPVSNFRMRHWPISIIRKAFLVTCAFYLEYGYSTIGDWILRLVSFYHEWFSHSISRFNLPERLSWWHSLCFLLRLRLSMLSTQLLINGNFVSTSSFCSLLTYRHIIFPIHKHILHFSDLQFPSNNKNLLLVRSA